MKILFLSSEVVPWSKTGGLADVAGALPQALAALGHEVLVATPHYGSISPEGLEPAGPPLTLRFPFGQETATFHLASPAPGYRVLFVGNPRFFARDGIYGDAFGEFGDNHRRFAFFTMAALSGSQRMNFPAEIVHLNDWQTGLAALALRRGYRGTALEHAKTVFTIHNLAYQGVYPKSAMDDLGLPWDVFVTGGVEFYDQLSFLKAALSYSDALTTVSERYAEEIRTPEAGWGVDGLLRGRSRDLHGILNGVDVEEWNPATDPHLPARFQARDLSGKDVCKRALLAEYGLPAEPAAPLFGIISRMVSQKGFDILLPVVRRLLSEGTGMRLVVLGTGEPRFEGAFQELARSFPDKVAVRIGYDVGLSHRIEAGSDFFFMPSLYEPCGLNQMYSLLYGTLPIVRAVGGLDDTVRDFSEPGGNGVKFAAFNEEALYEATTRALTLYGQPARLGEVRRVGMGADFSWSRSAARYVSLYESLLSASAVPKARKAK